MAQKTFSSIVLAAGKGVRMKSSLPKVLHPVAGTPILLRTLEQLKKAKGSELRIVVGYGESLVRKVVEPFGAFCFSQKEQKGTADAVRSAQPENLEGPVLILNGDHPLLEKEDIQKIYDEYKNGPGGILLVTAKVKNPGNYGRIVRHQGMIRAIVEAKDASVDTLKINEVNTGIYMMDAKVLNQFLPMIQNNNAQKEFYLTDIIGLAIENNVHVQLLTLSPRVAAGVNSQLELAVASKKLFIAQAKKHLENGVVIIDPKNTYIEENVEIGPSTVIYPGAYIKRGTKIGAFCVLETNVFVNASTIEDSVQIRAGSYLEECIVRAKAIVGPYARLRPESDIGEDARVGNFVEMKKVKFGKGAKANHLTYLGDAEIGEGTNIGCGTITCNYAADKKKYMTKIGKDCFIGSDSQFVAPVTVGDGAVIGSGSTITKDVPARALGVARSRQVIKENYSAKGSDKKCVE